VVYAQYMHCGHCGDTVNKLLITYAYGSVYVTRSLRLVQVYIHM